MDLQDKINELLLKRPPNFERLIINERKRYFGKFDEQLDTCGYGSLYLKRPEIAKIVSDRLHELDGTYYNLCAYCIMPNHVHMLIDFSTQMITEDQFMMDEIPESYTPLYEVMRLIKGNTSYYINKVLGRKGSLWQKESYDHYVRNHKEYNNILAYILDNPVKAGLITNWEDWPFTYIKEHS